MASELSWISIPPPHVNTTRYRHMCRHNGHATDTCVYTMDTLPTHVWTQWIRWWHADDTVSKRDWSYMCQRCVDTCVGTVSYWHGACSGQNTAKVAPSIDMSAVHNTNWLYIHHWIEKVFLYRTTYVPFLGQKLLWNWPSPFKSKLESQLSTWPQGD
jgi:hypothetical protein